MANAAATFPAARLKAAFSRRCVSAWLGYGDALFLGFGDAILPPPSPNGPHVKPEPPFELATNFADWRLAAADTSPIGVEGLARAIGSLVDEQVLHWELLERNGLRLTFSGAKVLTVSPWDVAEGLSDAWCLASPDNRILAVATDGRAVVVDAMQPVRDWFKT